MCECAQGKDLLELYLTKMAFHFSAQNDSISQVKLAIMELAIHMAPPWSSKIRKSTFTPRTWFLSRLPQPMGRTVSWPFTHHPGGLSHFVKLTSHLEILFVSIPTNVRAK